jgi:hypothetical protein
MTDQDKEYLRDLMAMFALNGILSCNYDVEEEPAVLAYKYADEMMEARKPQEIGIKTVRKARNYAKNNTNS